MNWIKDNLIFILALLCLAGGLTLLVTVLVYRTKVAKLEADFSNVQADSATYQKAAETNAANVDSITKMYNQLVEKRRLETAEAKKKADELVAEKARTAQLVLDARALRARLAARDAQIDEYLNSAMPQPLACQLFPEAEPCAKP